MSDAPPSLLLERQIERIHQLLESEDAQVTWNDRIPDPDVPSRTRQIDITIRRDNFLTVIECRIHKAPQDVTWIDELIGRRISLRANAVIAVSASGFTSTARIKAARHGIILRNLDELSTFEVQNWGRKRRLTLHFLEFTDVTAIFPATPGTYWEAPKVTNNDGGPIDPLFWRMRFQDAARHLADRKLHGQSANLSMSFAAPHIRVNGFPLISMRMTAQVRRVQHNVCLASVVVYADPTTDVTHAEVGKFSLGDSEIIEDRDRLSVVIDLSTVTIPDNCLFETVTFDAGRVVNAKLSLVGERAMIACNCPITFKIEYLYARAAEGLATLS